MIASNRAYGRGIGRNRNVSSPSRRALGCPRVERWGVVAVGAVRCLEPQVVANHLLGLKNSKLRVDMGLCLHWLRPTTGLRETDVTVIPRIFIIDISRLFASLRRLRGREI